MTAIALHFGSSVKRERGWRWYLLASTIAIFLANWVNPLTSLYSLPVYLLLLVITIRKIRILTFFSLSTLFGIGFLFYGIRSGEISGISAPSLAEFNHVNIYIPLLLIQILTAIFIAKIGTDKVTRDVLFLTAISWAGWPLMLLVSSINEVKANLYSDRYFIPIILVSFILQVICLTSLIAQRSFDFQGERFVRFKQKGLTYQMVFSTIFVMIAANLVLIPVEIGTFPLDEHFKRVGIQTLENQRYPNFIIGDYWSSWPMKLFFTGQKTPPVIAYRMEGQSIFQSGQAQTLRSIMHVGAKGICFGSMTTCMDLLKRYSLDLSIDQNLSLRSEKDLFIEGQAVHQVVLEQNKKHGPCWTGSELPTQIGSIAGPSKVAIFANPNIKGFLTYGPYVTISPGKYTTKVFYEVSSDVGNPVGVVDRAAEGKYLPRSSVTVFPSLIGKNFFEVNFQTAVTLPNFEVRVFDNGATKLQVDSICIIKNS